MHRYGVRILNIRMGMIFMMGDYMNGVLEKSSGTTMPNIT